MKRSSGFVAALMTLTAGWVTPVPTAEAADGPDVVFDEATFFYDNEIVSTQRFETPEVFPADQFLITIDDVNYESTDPANPYWKVVDGVLIRAFEEFGPATDDIDIVLTFGTDQVVHAVGLDLARFGRRQPDPYEFTVVEADGTSTVFPFDLNVTGDLYVGFSSEVGIVSVTIHEGMSGDGVLSNFSLDNVSRSALVAGPAISASVEYTNGEAIRVSEDHARVRLDGVIKLQGDLRFRTVGAEIKIAGADLWWSPDSGMPVSSAVAHTVRPVPTSKAGEYTFTTTIDLRHDPRHDPRTDPTYQFEAVVPTIVVETAIGGTVTPGPTFRQTGDIIAIPAFMPGARVGGAIARVETGRAESDISVNLFERAADGSRGRFLGNSKTDDDGRYRHDLVPGCYVLTFIAPVGSHFLSYRTGPGDRFLNRMVCVSEGEQPRLDAKILFDKSVNASISGQVVLDTGAPVEGVSANLFLADTDSGSSRRGMFLGNARTGDDGRYRHDVAAGCYVLTFVAPSGDAFSNGSRYLNRSLCIGDLEQADDVNATLRRDGPAA